MLGERTIQCRFCGQETIPTKLRRHWQKICENVPQPPADSKLCSGCQQIKSRTDFYKHSTSADGIKWECKSCSKARMQVLNETVPRADKPKIDSIGRTISLRPGRWKLKPCRYCGQGFNTRGMQIHLHSCAKHPRKRGKYSKFIPDLQSLPDMEELLKTQLTREERRRHGSIKQYGITLADYNRMLASQNGVCAICGKPPSGKRNSRTIHLAVDHSHMTGDVRSLLCSHCNAGIGGFKDDPALLRAAIAYIESHSHTVSESSEIPVTELLSPDPCGP